MAADLFHRHCEIVQFEGVVTHSHLQSPWTQVHGMFTQSQIE